MVAQWKTDGISALWPEINGPFLSLRGIPEHLMPVTQTQELYKDLLLGFDAITSCEMKELYKFKLFLNRMHQRSNLPPELLLIHKAFIAWVNFEYERARTLFTQHLKAYPSDIITIFFVHMLDFCTGKTPRLTAEFSFCEPHIPHTHALYSYYLAIKSFVLCEDQRFQQALELGLEAVRLIPHNIYGIHATAHALHEMGRWQELSSFLIDCKPDWIENSGMRMHVYWHMAIAHERCNEVDQALQAFEELYELKDSPFAKQDLDAVGFLWRLRLKATDSKFAAIWERLALLWIGSVSGSTSYFHKIHAALAFSATNQTLLIEKQIAESDGFGIEPEAHRAGLDVLKGILLFTLKRYHESLALLRTSRDQWPLLGGSRAQREVLDLTLEYIELKTRPIVEERAPA